MAEKWYFDANQNDISQHFFASKSFQRFDDASITSWFGKRLIIVAISKIIQMQKIQHF